MGRMDRKGWTEWKGMEIMGMIGSMAINMGKMATSLGRMAKMATGWAGNMYKYI